MNAATLAPRPWSHRRWWTLVALVFAAHLALIFILGKRKPVTPRSPAFAPTLSLAFHSNELFALSVKDPTLLRLAATSDELLALSDPTLFALPQRRGFAGGTRLQPPDEAFRWTEPARMLELPVDKLGTTFAQVVHASVRPPFEFEIKPAPDVSPVVRPDFQPPVSQRSTLKLADGLAQRRLLNPPALPSWPAADLLTNNVAQVLVDADGQVISAKLVFTPPGSGSAAADHWALTAARNARFDPQRAGAEKLALGLMIFEWHTVPLPATNSPATIPAAAPARQ